MKAAVDRIDEGSAVLIDRDDETRQIRLPLSLLPPGSREGDILTVSLERDEEETIAARTKVTTLIQKLRKSS